MRDARRLIWFIAVLALGSLAQSWGQGQVPPAPQQGAQPSPTIGKGFILGQVVDATDGKPIADVTVSMNSRAAAGRGAAGAGPPLVIVDAQGRFAFGSLPAGSYSLTASSTGYTSRSIVLNLADGEKILDARIRLTKTASVSGTLRDAVGDPVVNANVVVLNRAVVNGQQSWRMVNTSRSDDRGIYRVSDLVPGDYAVCACGKDPIPLDATLMNTLGSEPQALLSLGARATSAGTAGMSLDPTARTYAPTFHQNSTTLGRATKVRLAPGEEKTGIDMNVEIVRATRVSGAFLGAPGPIPPQLVRLSPAEYGSVSLDVFSLSPLLVQPDGRFDFAPVPPGQYRLVAVYRESAGRAGGGRGSAGALPPLPPPPPTQMNIGLGLSSEAPPLWADETLVVGESGLSGVSVTLHRAASIRGRVQWIGSAPQPTDVMLARATVMLSPVNLLEPLTAMSGSSLGRFAPDATFTVAGAVPGKYLVNPTALPGFPNMKSVVVGGLDVTDLPFEMADKDVSDVVITFVETPLALLTVTTNAAMSSPPFDDAWAMVFPVDRKYWTEPSAARRRFRQVAFSTKGSAALDGLPAGDYFVAVMTGQDTDWQEPGRLDALSRKAQRISLVDGDKRAIEVRR